MYSAIKDKEERKAIRRAKKIERLQKLQEEYENSLRLQQELAAQEPAGQVTEQITDDLTQKE